MSGALRIAILGAESTGKTELARALAAQLAARTGMRCTWVGEWLRDWCEREGRTPRADEQAAIARTQQAHIDAAAAAHDIVVCDTTAVMTAVYSELIFGDRSLAAYAAVEQRRCDLTLLTALDLPWVADGLQRDGPHVREPVDAGLRALLAAHGLRWTRIAGSGRARVEAALDAAMALVSVPPGRPEGTERPKGPEGAPEWPGGQRTK
ncbi:MAG: AAA family ATPase [Burkholderiales bacterium]|nr:AAA family ATPase [Burkholderiales bacterium]MDE1928591.1 AAA family ATPase [Burkholderiales bacterium]MDE2161054.1 AAA family ATPase [Burkholderiales bacterium]